MCLVAAAVSALAVGTTTSATRAPVLPIDRHALVARHGVVLRSFDTESPLSVGNGSFAFTADVTGLQTVPEAYEQTIPLGTLSDWGRHSSPNPQGWNIDRYQFREFDSRGGKVGSADIPGDERTPEVQWLRGNPHRLHLGRLGLALVTREGWPAVPADLVGIEQTLDLWNGELVSRFILDGQPVEVRTVCHPELDAVAVRIVSPLIRSGQLRVLLAFPYGTGQATAADWRRPDAHQTAMQAGTNHATFARRLDADAYHVSVAWQPAGSIAGTGAHHFTVTPARDASAFELTAVFSGMPIGATPPGFSETLRRVDRRDPEAEATGHGRASTMRRGVTRLHRGALPPGHIPGAGCSCQTS